MPNGDHGYGSGGIQEGLDLIERALKHHQRERLEYAERIVALTAQLEAANASNGFTLAERRGQALKAIIKAAQQLLTDTTLSWGTVQQVQGMIRDAKWGLSEE